VEVVASSIAKKTTEDFKEHKNQGNMSPPKECNNFPIMTPKK